jgi:hypothetical protein
MTQPNQQSFLFYLLISVSYARAMIQQQQSDDKNQVSLRRQPN